MINGAHVVVTSTDPEADHLPGGGKLNVYEPRHARPKH
jgi:hypothetical protein